MTIRDALKNIRIIQYLPQSPQVVDTVVSEFAAKILGAKIEKAPISVSAEPGILNIAIAAHGSRPEQVDEALR